MHYIKICINYLFVILFFLSLNVSVGFSADISIAETFGHAKTMLEYAAKFKHKSVTLSEYGHPLEADSLSRLGDIANDYAKILVHIKDLHYICRISHDKDVKEYTTIRINELAKGIQQLTSSNINYTNVVILETKLMDTKITKNQIEAFLVDLKLIISRLKQYQSFKCN